MKLSSDVLKKLLLDSKLITERDFALAADEAKRTGQEITDILVSRGLITEDYLFEIIGSYLQVPLAGLAKRTLDKKVLEILPESVSRAKRVAVFEKTDGALKVAMEDPGDLGTIEFLRQKTGLAIEPHLASAKELNLAFSLYKRDIAADFRKIIEENIRASVARRVGEDLHKAAEELPIITIVDSIIAYAVSLGASDIHFEILSDSLLIRFRIDGVLHEIVSMPKEVQAGLVARIKILSNLQIDEHAKPQDGRMKFNLENQVVDIRVAIMPTFYGEKVELRLLAATSKPLSLADLGMAEDTIKLVEENIVKTFGIILSTGPTGSGKTTTLYAILNKLNRPEVNICTIEDPIEYDIRYINQTQVNPKAGITFATGLRAILRQDPNIIMVGEIRDNETAEIAVHAALTGHLVLATLHTNDAPTAVPRLVDMGVAPFLVSATINAAIAQRLVRKICRGCIESYKIPPDMAKAVQDQLEESYLQKERIPVKVPTLLYRGKGCKACGFSGYLGRVGIFEFFNASEKVRELISSPNFTLDALKRLVENEGMVTMFADGVRKAALGVTTIEEVFRVIRE